MSPINPFFAVNGKAESGSTHPAYMPPGKKKRLIPSSPGRGSGGPKAKGVFGAPNGGVTSKMRKLHQSYMAGLSSPPGGINTHVRLTSAAALKHLERTTGNL